ncbi:MAG TPA: peptidoglycan editing factor PgeF [Tepidisphaeraceae bacterium]|nr:peptidoglycan editing factor PgeF [Tepidisphaeraceae bacterium]
MLERVADSSGVVYYRSPLLADAGVRHAFSTRLGGVSDGIFNSMNLGNPLATSHRDDPSHIEENYQRLQSAVGLGDQKRCWVHQVHGAEVVTIRPKQEFVSGKDQADAIVSDDPGRVLSVRIADCGPILLASEDGRVVAAVHAGWRGVVAGVLVETIKKMRQLTRANLLAAIGPCIGGDAMEVGPEVLTEFERAFAQDAPIVHVSNGKGRVDIRMGLMKQLANAGIAPGQIDTTDRCTHRDADEFFSHRRERGITGRMAALIAAGRE